MSHRLRRRPRRRRRRRLRPQPWRCSSLRLCCAVPAPCCAVLVWSVLCWSGQCCAVLVCAVLCCACAALRNTALRGVGAGGEGGGGVGGDAAAEAAPRGCGEGAGQERPDWRTSGTGGAGRGAAVLCDSERGGESRRYVVLLTAYPPLRVLRRWWRSGRSAVCCSAWPIRSWPIGRCDATRRGR